MNLMPFQELPFNGDIFARKQFLELKDKYNINVAVETGSCLFSTTKWLAENFDKVFTVESNAVYYNMGINKLSMDERNSKVMAILGDSVQTLTTVFSQYITKKDRVIFFLDAHWEQSCPLLDEIKAIQQMNLEYAPVIVIHDMLVPEKPELGYDNYNGQPFTVDWIRDNISLVYEDFGGYALYFNNEATGAMRGIVYIHGNRADRIKNVTQTTIPEFKGFDETKAPEFESVVNLSNNTLMETQQTIEAQPEQEEKGFNGFGGGDYGGGGAGGDFNNETTAETDSSSDTINVD